MKKFLIKLLIILTILLIIIVIFTGCKYRWLIPLGVTEIESLSFTHGINQNLNFQWSSAENELNERIFKRYK